MDFKVSQLLPTFVQYIKAWYSRDSNHIKGLKISVSKCHKRKKLVAWSGFQVSRNVVFFDKNHVKLRNPCYLISKKSVINWGSCWLKPCYQGTPRTYYQNQALSWNGKSSRSKLFFLHRKSLSFLKVTKSEYSSYYCLSLTHLCHMIQSNL